MASLLSHINSTLALIGEQPLLNTTGNLGNLAKREFQSALIATVQETRHSSFLSLADFTVSAVSPLDPAFALPVRTLQVASVYYKDTLDPTYPVLTKLVPRRLEQLTRLSSIGYAVVGNSVHIGQAFVRPFTATLEAYTCQDTTALADAAEVGLPQEVSLVVEAVAAGLLAASYTDDLAAQNTLKQRAQLEVENLRKRAGALRAPISWR